ncbi:hypothetical protein MPS_3978 [Mycobacterium pseudoshottsii JCM 15466]|nr:hypothetical protein MPS_3978 [Mycobacterium pseudoshottsii JCM 15466]
MRVRRRACPAALVKGHLVTNLASDYRKRPWEHNGPQRKARPRKRRTVSALPWFVKKANGVAPR